MKTYFYMQTIVHPVDVFIKPSVKTELTGRTTTDPSVWWPIQESICFASGCTTTIHYTSGLHFFTFPINSSRRNLIKYQAIASKQYTWYTPYFQAKGSCWVMVNDIMFFFKVTKYIKIITIVIKSQRNV